MPAISSVLDRVDEDLEISRRRNRICVPEQTTIRRRAV